MSEVHAIKKSDHSLPAGHFFGEILKKDVSDGLVLSEIRHGGGIKLPKHHHELAFFNLLLRGRYQEHYGDDVLTLEPLSVIFTPPGVAHRDEIARCGMHIFSIELDSRWLERLAEHGLVPRNTIDRKGSELAWLTTRLYREYRERYWQSPLTVEGLVLEMLALVGGNERSQEKRPPAWLLTVLDLLEAEFQSNLSVNYLASQVHVNPMHLSRVFRQFQKQSVGDYLHSLRIRFAVSQLYQPDLPLAAIATSAGFADQSHFTRVFKRCTGMTPAAFRSTWYSCKKRPLRKS